MAKSLNPLLLVLAMLLGQGVQAVTWSLPYAGQSDGTLARTLQSFASAVAAATRGAIALEPSPGASSANIEADLRQGRVPAGVLALSTLARDDSLIGMDQVPFLATSFADARKLWQVVRPRVEQRLKNRELVLLYAVPGSPRALLSRQPLSSLEALRGLRVVADAPRLTDFARLTGAKAVTGGSASQLLGSAKAELAFVSADVAVADRAWRYGRYFIQASAWFPKQLVVLNRGALSGLERGLRDALLTSADSARDASWGIAQRDTARRVQNLRDRGVKVRTPEVGFLIRLEELGRALLFAWSEDAGEEGAALVEAYYDIK